MKDSLARLRRPEPGGRLLALAGAAILAALIVKGAVRQARLLRLPHAVSVPIEQIDPDGPDRFARVTGGRWRCDLAVTMRHLSRHRGSRTWVPIEDDRGQVRLVVSFVGRTCAPRDGVTGVLTREDRPLGHDVPVQGPSHPLLLLAPGGEDWSRPDFGLFVFSSGLLAMPTAFLFWLAVRPRRRDP